MNEKVNLEKELFMVEHGVSQEQACNLAEYIKKDIEATQEYCEALCEESFEEPVKTYDDILIDFTDRQRKKHEVYDRRIEHIYEVFNDAETRAYVTRDRVTKLEKVNKRQAVIIFILTAYCGIQALTGILEDFLK